MSPQEIVNIMNRSVEYRREKIGISILGLLGATITGLGVFFSLNSGYPLFLAVVTAAFLSVICLISGFVGLVGLSAIVWPVRRDDV